MSALRRRLGVVLIVLMIGAGGTAQADDASVAQHLEQVLASLSSVRAEFTQEVRRSESGAVEHAHGTLAIKKPGRFRWDYAQPQQLIVCDGDRLWLYDPELEQATVKKVREALAQTPAMILSGESKVSEHYRVRAGAAAEGGETAILTPKAGGGDFREVRIGLAGNELRRLEFVDRLNQRTTIVLSRVEHNPTLKDSLFEFTPPAGVDVIGNR
jgi:outer membrane lipoprotein carrier protein